MGEVIREIPPQVRRRAQGRYERFLHTRGSYTGDDMMRHGSTHRKEEEDKKVDV